jgi:uncharacterized Zn finger protein (UPF0148 family)
MIVRVRCPNGHLFKCRPEHLGKRARCPKQGCGVVFVLDALAEETTNGAGGSTLNMTIAAYCPICDSPLKSGAVVCTECGTDLLTGRPKDEDDEQPEETTSSMPASVIHRWRKGFDADTEREGMKFERGTQRFSGALSLPLAEETRVRIEDFAASYQAVVEVLSDAWYLFHKSTIDMKALHGRIERGLRARCPICNHIYPSPDLASRVGVANGTCKQGPTGRYVRMAEPDLPKPVCPSCGSRDMLVRFDPTV